MAQVRSIAFCSVVILCSCNLNSSNDEIARFKQIADRQLAAEGIDPARYDKKQVLVGAKRVIVNYEDSSSDAVMEGQPVIFIDKADGRLISIHMEQ